MTVKAVHLEFASRFGSMGSVVVAGGAVRDELLGRCPKDFDVFVLGVPHSKEAISLIADGLTDLRPIGVLDFHKSEPFLVSTVEWSERVVQVMCSPHRTIDELLDSFDWNVSRFAFDGQIHAKTDLSSIASGRPLVLHRVTYPFSTLRRGFRFSERFGMRFERTDILRLCADIAAKAATGGIHEGQ